MFGKRTVSGARDNSPAVTPQPVIAPKPAGVSAGQSTQTVRPIAEPARSDSYYATKSMIFGALVEGIDLSQLSRLDAENAREEIRDIVHEIIAIKSVAMSTAEQKDLIDDICNDVLGYGPLEPLLGRDDIADIMVNGATQGHVERSKGLRMDWQPAFFSGRHGLFDEPAIPGTFMDNTEWVAGCEIWMGIGIFVMRNIINFDI